jgi:hypothetical protein
MCNFCFKLVRCVVYFNIKATFGNYVHKTKVTFTFYFTCGNVSITEMLKELMVGVAKLAMFQNTYIPLEPKNLACHYC